MECSRLTFLCHKKNCNSIVSANLAVLFARPQNSTRASTAPVSRELPASESGTNLKLQHHLTSDI